MGEKKELKIIRLYEVNFNNCDEDEETDYDFPQKITLLEFSELIKDYPIAKVEFDNKPDCYFEYKLITNDEIREMIQNDEVIDLRGRYISFFDINKLDLPIENKKIKGIKASYSLWHGVVNFNNVIFDSGNVSFAYAKFEYSFISFWNARFLNKVVCFLRLDINKGKFDLSGAIFTNTNVNFAYANFENCSVELYNTNFGDGEIIFDNARFNNKYFFLSNVYFGTGEVSFRETNFGICQMKFDVRNMSKSKLDFTNAISDGEIEFFFQDFEYVNLSFKRINKLIINNCVNKALIKISGEIKELSFKNTINLGRINLDWEKTCVKQAIENAYSLRKRSYRDSNESTIFDFEKSKNERYYYAAQDFLLLKENYRNIGEYEWEDSAYRAYMKYNTKSMKWLSKDFLKKLFNGIFGLISGYGTNVGRMLITCPVVMLLFGFSYLSAFIGESSMPFWKSMYFSAITFLTIGYGDISPVEMAFSRLQVLLTGVEGFLGLLLMSLVTVVVVRKVLR